MNETVSVDTIYDLRLAQPNKRRGEMEAREARRFIALANICVTIHILTPGTDD